MLIIITLLTICLLLFIGLYIQAKTNLNRFKEKYLPPEAEPQTNSQLERLVASSDLNTPIAVDLLTGLPGREIFEDRLLQAVHQSNRTKTQFAVLLLNINDFHLINDVQGYDIGDKLLKAVATRLQPTLRQVDTMTRFAGDIFVCLILQLSRAETAAYVAQRLFDCLAQPFQIDNKTLSITANIGIAIFPQDGLDANTMMNKANEAYIKSKALGIGKFCFYHQELFGMSEREISLHALLTSWDFLQKFSVYYHSHMNISTNETVCIEAIPYINHPDYGLISFVEFVAVAERCGKMAEISLWTFRHAIQQFKKWHQNGLNPHSLLISVTLRQVEDSDFLSQVAKMIEEFDILPNQLTFEIIESTILNTKESLENAFTMLSNLGIKIAITVLSLGHFALQKINKMPISFLIIEASLFDNSAENQAKEPIILTMIGLATEMKITIMAKGVENDDQKNYLEALGCHVMEGKLFGEPHTSDEITD